MSARATGVPARATALRAFAAALAGGALVVSLGCSHGPKPRSASAEPASDDSLNGRRDAHSGTGRSRPAGTRSGAADAPPSAQSGSSSSAPAPAAADTSALLQPALAPEERAKLEEKTRTTIEAARTLLESFDAARLDAERLRKYRLASDFLAEAVRARDARDVQRASTLALKAKLLAEEL